MIDVCIIGAGVCGAAVARELSKYKLEVLCLEKENDVADGTSKANSGIVHAGYDPKPGTLMAKYNVLGNQMIEQLAKDLDITYVKSGSLVIAFDETDMKTIEDLYQRGIENGVPDLSLISKEKIKELEPNITENLQGALWAQSAGVVSPWELAIAQFDNAVTNGVTVQLSHEVVGIDNHGDYFTITSNCDGNIESVDARFIVNATGVYSDQVLSFVSTPNYRVIPNKGQYYLLDKSQGELVTRVIFQCPSKQGKGILVSPTAHGNLIVGPDSVDIDDRDDVSTTAGQLAYIRKIAARTCGKINYRESIRNFSGVRAQSEVDEFLIGTIPESKQFINLANIKSPGLTASPAIALDVISMLQESGLQLTEKENYISTRKIVRFNKLSDTEKNEVIKQDKHFGRVICRCETITEGEILAAIHAPIPARSIDAVKRRCNAGMGRCQGGFCSPRVLELISHELGMAPETVCKDKAGSNILLGKTMKGGN